MDESRHNDAPDDAAIVALLREQLSQRYEPTEVQVALAMWESYLHYGAPSLSQVPQNVAAVEWLIAATHGYSLSLKELCAHYQVSSTEVESLFSKMVQVLEIPPEDLWDDEDQWEEEWEADEVDLEMTPAQFLTLFEQSMTSSAKIPAVDWNVPTTLEELGLEALQRLPKHSTTWIGGVFNLEQWLVEPMPHHPRVVLWLDQQTELVLGYQILHFGEGAEEVLGSLVQVMTRPEVGRAGTPSRLLVANPSLRDPLATLFAPCGVEVETGGEEALLDIVELMDVHLDQEPREEDEDYPDMGYLEGGRFNDRLLRTFFEESARLFAARPWENLSLSTSFLLQSSDGLTKDKILTLSGQSEESFQFVVFEDVESRTNLRHMAEASQQLQLPPIVPYVSFLRLLCVERHQLPAEFVKEVNAHKWRLEGEDCFPFLGLYNTLHGELLLRQGDYEIAIEAIRLWLEWDRAGQPLRLEREGSPPSKGFSKLSLLPA